MKKFMTLVIMMVMTGMLISCGENPTGPEPTPEPTPTPTPKTITLEVTGNVPELITISYYDENNNHHSGVKVSLPWSKSWIVLPGYSEILQISAARIGYNYEDTKEYQLTSKILKNNIVLGSDTVYGVGYIHACATESVKY